MAFAIIVKNNMKKILLVISIIAFVLLGIVLFSKNNTSRLPSNHLLQVTASFYPMYYFALQIGGNKANVYNITPASAEPHDYEPSTQDIVRMTQSNMLVLNGGKLEPWGDKIRDQL